MANQIKQTLYYYYRYSIKPVRLFWSIFFLFLTLTLLLSTLEDFSFQFTGITSIISIIFMIFFPIFTFKNIFPFVIKLGVTRKAFIIATYFYSVILSLIMTAFNYIYLYFFNIIAEGLSVEGFDYVGLNMEGFVETLFGNIYLFDWLIHLTLFLLFTFIGAFFYRFGMVYGVIFIALFPLSMLIKSIGLKVIELLSYLNIFHENYTATSYLLMIIICVVLNWFIVQRASVVDQITKQN